MRACTHACMYGCNTHDIFKFDEHEWQAPSGHWGGGCSREDVGSLASLDNARLLLRLRKLSVFVSSAGSNSDQTETSASLHISSGADTCGGRSSGDSAAARARHVSDSGQLCVMLTQVLAMPWLQVLSCVCVDLCHTVPGPRSLISFRNIGKMLWLLLAQRARTHARMHTYHSAHAVLPRLPHM